MAVSGIMWGSSSDSSSLALFLSLFFEDYLAAYPRLTMSSSTSVVDFPTFLLPLFASLRRCAWLVCWVDGAVLGSALPRTLSCEPNGRKPTRCSGSISRVNDNYKRGRY